MSFPGGTVVKNPPASTGDTRDSCLIPGSGRSSGEGWQPTPVFLPGNFHGKRSWVGYSPWGHTEMIICFHIRQLKPKRPKYFKKLVYIKKY